MFEKLRRWLRGEFTCRKCGRTIALFAFGYGEAICPECYTGEKEIVFPDRSYWLNRLLRMP